MKRIDISGVIGDFPDYRVAVVVARELVIAATRSAQLSAHIAALEDTARAQWQGRELSQIPGIAAWRKAYRQFGIKKTSYRSSVERLVKNALAERALPEINSFVDAYNAVSLAHVLPAGADDLDRVDGDIFFRYAMTGDTFIPLGRDGADPPKSGEVVYCDASKVLCRRLNWYQDARSPVTLETRAAVVTVQSNGCGDVMAAAGDLVELFTTHCQARCDVTVASSEAPVMDLAGT